MIKKQPEVSTEETENVINVMFSRLKPEDRERILNYIDDFMIKSLNIPKEQIPWFNPKKNKAEDCRHVCNLMRIAFAKVFNHLEKNFKNQIH